MTLAVGPVAVASLMTFSALAPLAEVGSRTISATAYRDSFNAQLQSFSRRLGRALTPDDARQLGFDRQVLRSLLRDAATWTPSAAGNNAP